jgi:hypothetical protein
MITKDETLIEGVKNFLREGGDIDTATPDQCFDHIEKGLHDYVVSLERKQATGGTEHARNIRLLIGKNYADGDRTLNNLTMMKMYKGDGWVDEKQDNVCLVTMARSREYDPAIGWELLNNLAHEIDAEVDEKNAAIVMHAAVEGQAGKRIDDIDLKVDMDFVIMPRSFTNTTVKANGAEHLTAAPKWQKKYEGLDPIVVDGVTVARVETRREGHRRFYMMVSGPFNIKGEIQNDPVLSASFSRIIGSMVNGVTIAEAPDYTEEDVAAYHTAASLLDIIKATAGENKDIETTLARELEDSKQHIESAMNTIANMTKRINDNSSKLKEIRSGNMEHVVESTIGIIGEMNRISSDAPVKSCELNRTPDGDTYFDIRMHPCVLDVEEESSYRGDGEPLIILNDLRLHLRLKVGGHVESVIKWVDHDGSGGYMNGEKRCHPHYSNGGRACWGDAGAEIARAIGDGNWHDLMQWVYAWCGGYRTNDRVITYCENFPTAPDGSVVGWQIP